MEMNLDNQRITFSLWDGTV